VAEKCMVPANGMVMRSNTRLEPGVYVLPDGLTIDADNVTLDGNGATLIGVDRKGAGVTVRNHAGVTIRNVRLREYAHGIVARQCQKLTVEANHVTSTAEVDTYSLFLTIGRQSDDPYGGGILLDHVDDGQIVDNDVQHQMNGLLTYHCNRLSVLRNLASYNSGFGIHLHHTCDSLFEGNWADYCCRWEPRDKSADKPRGVTGQGCVGHMGAYAAGFVIVEASCRNVFRRNAARLGGDGFFLAGGVRKGENLGCNDNLFEFNDGSLSPNIAFEATFSRGNIFRNNWADRCNFGFWLGCSEGYVLEGNRMLYNRQAGVAADHAASFQVRGNDFQSNGHGILTWTTYNEGLHATSGDQFVSRGWTIEGNKFYKNDFGIAIRADRDHGIRPVAPEISGKAQMRPHDHVIRENDIQDNRVGIQLFCADRTVIERNKINKNVEADVRCEDDHDTKLGHNLGMRGAYL